MSTDPDKTTAPPAWTLPSEGDALPLVVPDDFQRAATTLGVEMAAIRSVATVESGGRTGFEKTKKRPKIRYENHYFQRLTDGKYDASHPDLSCGYNSAGYKKTHAKGHDQWALLEAAFALDADAAVQSVSWGMFQIMGENYEGSGWTDLHQFVTDMFQSEGNHLKAFVGLVQSKHLVRHLKARAWARFAASYNGPAYRKNAYDVKMAQYYAQYTGHTKPKKAPPKRKKKHA